MQDASTPIKLYLHYTGNVHSFVHSSNGPRTLSQENVDTIAEDLSNAFSLKARDDYLMRTNGQYMLQLRTVKADDIKDVYVFTWLRMAHKTNVRIVIFHFLLNDT